MIGRHKYNALKYNLESNLTKEEFFKLYKISKEKARIEVKKYEDINRIVINESKIENTVTYLKKLNFGTKTESFLDMMVKKLLGKGN